jgi:hypothetical protein
VSKKRIFKTKTFSKAFSKSDLSDVDLLNAVKEMEQGLYEADLGGYVYKKRIAIGNRGKSQGARTIVATKLGRFWFFIFGFKKKERANINNVELAHLQKVAELHLGLTADQIDQLIQDKSLIEVKHDNDKK